MIIMAHVKLAENRTLFEKKVEVFESSLKRQ